MRIHRSYGGLDKGAAGAANWGRMGEHSAREEIRVERNRFIARVFLGVSLSILLHVIVSVITYEYSRLYEEPAPRKTTLVEWIEPSDIKKDQWNKAEDQIVRKTELPADMLDLNVKPVRRFLSEDKQTVKKEMRARASGMTENRTESMDLSPSRPASQQAAEAVKESKASKSTSTEPSKNSSKSLADLKSVARGKSGATNKPLERLPEIVPNSIFEEGLGDVTVDVKHDSAASGTGPRGQERSESRELILPTDPRRNRGVSTTGEQLPQDIQIGDFTALNTDRFIYYTYYARIEEQIRHRWVRYVKAAIFGGGDLREGQKEYTTNLEIVMNREGDFVRAIIHDGSGSRDVDAAPIMAFREAKRVPHPPREMVKEDGTIRLYYSFHVDQLPPIAHTKGAAVKQPDGLQ